MAKRAFVRAWRAHQPPFRCETYSRQYLKQMLPMKGGGSAQKKRIRLFHLPTSLSSAGQLHSKVPTSKTKQRGSDFWLCRFGAHRFKAGVGRGHPKSHCKASATRGQGHPHCAETCSTHAIGRPCSSPSCDSARQSQPGSQSLAEP